MNESWTLTCSYLLEGLWYGILVDGSVSSLNVQK
jgi:hypothetical protein